MKEIRKRRRLPPIPPLLWAALGYIILSIIVTYPVITQLSSGLAGISGDSLQHLWSLWWGKKAFLDLHTSLADVSLLYYPQDIKHSILGVTPWIQIVAAPLVYFFGPLVAYNLGLLLAIIVSGITAFLLTYEITEDYLAAFLGGVVFAFAPTRLIHAFGHYAQIMTYLFPLYTLFLIRLLKHPSYKKGFIAGILLTLSLLVNFVHVAYFVIPVTLILVGYFAVTNWARFWSPDRFFPLALTAIIALILTAPFFLPLLLRAGSGGLGFLGASGVSELGADVLAFIIPSPLHPLIKNNVSLRQTLSQIVGPNPIEGLVYMGLIPLFLAFLGVRRKRLKARPWLLTAVITLIFSLGPFLKVAGDFVTYEVDGRSSYFILPYAILTELPIFEYARTPARINGTTTMALAVLVGLGVTVLRSWLRRKRLPPMLLLGLVPIILFEYLVAWPFPVTNASIPDFYYQLRQETEDFAILDYPIYLPDSPFVTSPDFPMYYQTVHEKPIVGGYIWRLPPGTDGTMRMLNNLVSPEPLTDFSPLPPLEKRASALQQFGIHYVIVHKYDTHTRTHPLSAKKLKNTTTHLVNLLGQPTYEDQYIIVYEVPKSNASLSETQLLIAPGKNWTRQEWTDEGVWRWMTGQESDFYIYGRASNPHRLAFTARSLDAPRHVEILVNDQPIGEIVIDEERRFLSPVFELPLEQNQITLRVREECEFLSNNSTFCLSLYVSDVQLISESALIPGEDPVACTFDNQIELLGYDLPQSTAQSGETLELILYWQSLAPIEHSYTVFTHLLDAKGQIVSQHDKLPLYGSTQTNWWTPGEIVADPYQIPIPVETVTDTQYTLSTGLYLWPSGSRLSVDESCPLPTAANAIFLTDIKVENKP